MFDPAIQYRCTIIRGKAQKELDNLLPAYANIITDICPCNKAQFDDDFNARLSSIIYDDNFENLTTNNKKTIRNHITEIAGKLFGLYFIIEDTIYESESNKKLLDDSDQPAFFKNLCLNFQFPNGTQKIQTIKERIGDNIRFKPFHFILALISKAKYKKITLTSDEIGYYVLNAKQVLQGLISVDEVLNKISIDRENKSSNKLKAGSYNVQHIREQFNLLVLANLIYFEDDFIFLNESEKAITSIFINDYNSPLKFDIYDYNLKVEEDKKLMYSEWSEYFGKVAVEDYTLISTSVEALQGQKVAEIETVVVEKKGTNKKELGDAGESYVFELEKSRVSKTHPRLVNKVLLFGEQRGLGYDILSVEADENKIDPEFARFIEVKSTKRVTEPDLNDTSWVDTIGLTRKEWIAAKQYGIAYNIYRVYFTPRDTIVRKINNPYAKNQNNLIAVLPTAYRMDFSSQSIDKQY